MFIWLAFVYCKDNGRGDRARGESMSTYILFKALDVLARTVFGLISQF